MGDLKQPIFRAIFESDEEKKAQLIENLKKDSIPFYLKKFSEILEKNNGGKYFVSSVSYEFYFVFLKIYYIVIIKTNIHDWLFMQVGKSLTYADLSIAHFLQVFSEKFDGLLKEFPLIRAHQETVFNTPGIKEWVEKRPKTEF